jgi:hypothetical protein
MTDFQRLREKRLPKTIKALQLIGNLSTYKHTRAEAEDVVAVLELELQKLRQRFKLDPNTSTHEPAEESTTREPVAPPADLPRTPEGRISRHYYASRNEAMREAQAAPVKLKSAGIIKCNIELEPDAGWVVVIHATREIPAAAAHGWEVRVYD